MLQIKKDKFNTIEETLNLSLPKEERVLYVFEIIPLDYNPIDLLSPKVYLTLNHFIFTYDDIIEIHELNKVDFEIIGDNPKFSALQHLTEGSLIYDYEHTEDIIKYKNENAYTRVNYFEQGQIPKNILLRKERVSAKPYQTWAMFQIILNIKHRVVKDETLEEMLDGNFQKFNQKTVIYFMYILVGYFILQTIVSFTIKGIIGTIVDVIFGIILIGMAYWTYKSLENNNFQFYNTYLKYKTNNSTSENSRIIETRESN